MKTLRLVSDRMGLTVLRRISSACPNGQIRFAMNLNIESLIAIGRSATSWKVVLRDQSCTEDSFSLIGNSCPNLQECVLHLTGKQPLSYSAFESFVDVPKPMLRSFDVCFAKLSHISTILQVLTAQADSLETFSYLGPCPSLQHLRTSSTCDEHLSVFLLRLLRT